MTIAELDTVSSELLSLESSLNVTQQDLLETLKSVYRNGYFTNHGPLAIEFENQLESYLGVGNVVTVGNESLALLISSLGICDGTEVIAPSFGCHVVSQVVTWLGLNVSYCDVDISTGHPTIDDVLKVTNSKIQTVFLTDPWGQRVPTSLVDGLVAHGFSVVLVAFESFGASRETQLVSTSDQVATVFSFGPDSLLETLQGGAIATNNDDWAARFRNTRSSYGSRHKVDVKATCNGRFSELQAGLGIRSLSKLDAAMKRCQAIHAAMENMLADNDRVEAIFKQPEGVPNHARLPVLRQNNEQVSSKLTQWNKDRWPVSAELMERTVSIPVCKFKSIEHGLSFADRFLETLSQ